MKESTPRLRSLCGLFAIMAISSTTACQMPVNERVQPGDGHGWRIDEQVGSAHSQAPGQTYWQLIHPDGPIRPGNSVSTSSDSLLILASDDDTITASGRSRFTLPSVEQGTSRVRQDSGRIRYEIESTPDRRFEVQTPYMATVVKGTTFVVSVSRKEAQVRVIEGRVWLVGCNGDLLAEMTAGQVGSIAAPPGAVGTSATDLEQSTDGSRLEPDVTGRNSGAASTVEGMAPGRSSIAASAQASPDCFVTRQHFIPVEEPQLLEDTDYPTPGTVTERNGPSADSRAVGPTGFPLRDWVTALVQHLTPTVSNAEAIAFDHQDRNEERRIPRYRRRDREGNESGGSAGGSDGGSSGGSDGGSAGGSDGGSSGGSDDGSAGGSDGGSAGGSDGGAGGRTDRDQGHGNDRDADGNKNDDPDNPGSGRNGGQTGDGNSGKGRK